MTVPSTNDVSLFTVFSNTLVVGNPDYGCSCQGLGVDARYSGLIRFDCLCHAATQSSQAIYAMANNDTAYTFVVSLNQQSAVSLTVPNCCEKPVFNLLYLDQCAIESDLTVFGILYTNYGLPITSPFYISGSFLEITDIENNYQCKLEKESCAETVNMVKCSLISGHQAAENIFFNVTSEFIADAMVYLDIETCDYASNQILESCQTPLNTLTSQVNIQNSLQVSGFTISGPSTPDGKICSDCPA